MVKSLTAGLVGDDSLHIVLEGVGTGTDRDGHWLLGDGHLQCLNAVLLDVRVVSDLDLAGEWREAAVCDAGVGILLLGDEVVHHSILEAVGLQATVATLGFFVTVDALLLG